MTKLTPKQNIFTRSVAEGSTYAEAYRTAYSAGNMASNSVCVEASRLMSDPNVSLMVMELQAAARERTLVTIESLTNEYEEARQLAKEEGQAAAMSTATTGKGKLHGMFEKDNQQQQPDLETSLTPVNFARRIAFALRLGQESLD